MNALAPATPPASSLVVGSSFYAALRILPPAQRQAMYEVYAFCRAVDDIADDPGPRPQRMAALDRWRQDLDLLYSEGAVSELTRGLATPVNRFALRLEDFSTFSGEAVIAAAALFGLFDPASGEPAAVFEAREQRVESGHVEAKGTGRTELDETGDIVPVAGFLFEKGEDEELGAAFLPFGVGLNIVWFHIWESHIWTGEAGGC